MSYPQQNEYETVVLRKKLISKPVTEFATYQAKVKGQVESVQRRTGGNYGAHQSEGSRLSALDAAQSGDYKPATVTRDFKLALAQARQAKGWNQQQLATAINVTQKQISDYEAGRLVPTGPVVNLLNRKLGITLPKRVKTATKMKGFGEEEM